MENTATEPQTEQFTPGDRVRITNEGWRGTVVAVRYCTPPRASVRLTSGICIERRLSALDPVEAEGDDGKGN